MISNKWDEIKLSEIANITMGQSPKGETCNNEKEGIALLNGPTEFGSNHPYPTQYTLDPKKKSKKGDLLFCVRGSTTGRMNWSNQPYAIGRGIAAISPIFINTDRFLKAAIEYNLPKILSMATGSTFPNVSRGLLTELKILAPNPIEMSRINELLKCIEDKIELNNKINENLENQAQAIFKHWFIDFEFPDESGNPYKSSGGEMVESELGMIPKEWSVSKLDKIIELHDSKRIPLSKRERDNMAKEYPYYGATSIIDYVDNYIFDGTYLLLGEDGSVSDDLGYPILQYVWGKFWVNNHAHIITGDDYITVEYLYMLFKNTNVNNIITGAVQKKINQRNLTSLKIINPMKQNILDYIKIIEPIFKNRKSLETQNEKLSKLRDTLLPKLMSGEIRIPLD